MRRKTGKSRPKCQGAQGSTVLEDKVAQRCHAIGDADRANGTASKSLRADGGHALWDDGCGQRRTTLEDGIADGLQTGRQFNSGKGRTSLKHAEIQLLKSVRQRHGGEIHTAAQGRIADSGNMGRYDKRRQRYTVA